MEEWRGPSDEPAVFDTSSLVFLDLLGYMPLLRQLYQVVLPEAVARELVARPDSPGSGVVSLEWVVRGAPGAESVHRVKREPPAVGRGETEVIALGLDLSCPVVLDYRKARLRARRAGLEITGTRSPSCPAVGARHGNESCTKRSPSLCSVLRRVR